MYRIWFAVSRKYKVLSVWYVQISLRPRRRGWFEEGEWGAKTGNKRDRIEGKEKEQLDPRYKLREHIHHSLSYFILFGDMRKCRTELPSSWTPHSFSSYVLRTLYSVHITLHHFILLFPLISLAFLFGCSVSVEWKSRPVETCWYCLCRWTGSTLRDIWWKLILIYYHIPYIPNNSNLGTVFSF